MRDSQRNLPVLVTASPQGDGVIMTVTNDSEGELRVRFPNPYTGIRLYTESGELVTIARTILCWEEDDPEIVLHPGASASALAHLYPFWFDLHGAFLAKCKLSVTLQEEESEEVIAEGWVKLLLGPPRLGQPMQPSSIPIAKPMLMNVSRFVRILGIRNENVARFQERITGT
jgi:hypothetical protein